MKNKMKNSAERGVKRAGLLLDAYQTISGDRNVAFVLADLRHYCDANDLNFYAALDESHEFYLKEKRP